jgi:heme ABC exporter ATP-binding subunit CcmA
MIATRELRKVFAANAVLDGIALDVAPGECVAVLGANGTGKSTLLRIVATTMRPTSGTVTLFGHDAVRFPERARGRIGFVAHGAHVWDDLTALENLRVWRTLGNRRADTAACMEALATVELEHAADERVRDFSAGMKRRLSIARYVDGAVDALLLDEPFTALDQQGKKWLTEFLLAFKARGGAILMATHDFGGSLEVADRLAVLAEGVVALDRARGHLDAREIEMLYHVQAGAPA